MNFKQRLKDHSFILLLLSPLIGCHHNKPVHLLNLDGSDGSPPWSRQDSLKNNIEYTRIDKSRFEWVNESARSKARRQLASVPWVQLTPVQAAQFSSKAFASQADEGVYVLLRGLESIAYGDDLITPLRDTLEVGWNAGTVRIAHFSSRGQPDFRSHQRAVIAFLPGPPIEVYPVTLTVVTGGIGIQ